MIDNNSIDCMKKWFLSLILIGVVLVSGCVEQDGEGPEYHDNALKMEYEVTEKIEKTRILPGQSIRMIVYLTNQVEKDTTNVDMIISNPYGIEISRVNCGSNCVCDSTNQGKKDCGNGISCYYNGCNYDKIQSLDEVEINFALDVPSEEEITSVGYELKPELTLEYDYDGQSMLFIPILRYGEKPTETKTEFTQTTGPIHVDIRSDKWVRGGSIFPLFVEVKDVVKSGEKIMIEKDDFKLTKYTHITGLGGNLGRCDFEGVSGCIGDPDPCSETANCDVCGCDRVDHLACGGEPTSCESHSEDACRLCGCNWLDTKVNIPIKNIELPMKDPLVCTLEAENPTVPMVKALIGIDYSYRYKIEKTETIRVEKGLF